ncbi:Protein translocase subunit SecE [Candidatus Kinetoplastibacterium sorsogonicusi]|uniref:Protein translocase subunit SecE n=1 Tax=Candidatus Kinetoplastidibacterium kentomonadis TaxID=1576550 RepID=A0A3Q8F734_9PROT|nr:preprotein translocase subunit SecE [Candidatus Kinetoplastibacterium sorsogonicusi]AWD32810.1 Protein translocase subunit SecE [Candidatus Kinetoplastibacterium sorsogonicusi]
MKLLFKMSNKIKNFISGSLFLAAILSYFLLKNNNFIVRLFFCSSLISLSVFILSLNSFGQNLLTFFIASYEELKKVIWPANKEIIHMAFLVFLFSILSGFFIWIIDKAIAFLIYAFLLGWK